MMRIIAGSARGTHLETLPGDATRPTTERAKEAVFSMLQFRLANRRVLDLFAGSGQLSLEALSRGAADAVLLDVSPQAVAVIRKNVQKTHMEERATVITTDYAAYLAEKPNKTFDLVFIDPPYAKQLVCPVLHKLLAGGFLRDGAILVCESAEDNVFANDPALQTAFTVLKTAKYAAVHVTVLQWGGEE